MRTISVKLFDFGPVVQEISFEDISYLELCQPLFLWSKTICAILVEGMVRNISVKLFLIWTSGLDQKKTSFKDISHLELWVPMY